MKILSGSTTSSSSNSASHDVTETIKIQRASAKKLGHAHRLNNNKLIIYYYQVIDIDICYVAVGTKNAFTYLTRSWTSLHRAMFWSAF